jgi:hypothetical protein
VGKGVAEKVETGMFVSEEDSVFVDAGVLASIG